MGEDGEDMEKERVRKSSGRLSQGSFGCEVPAKSWFQPALCPSGVASLPLANVSMRLQGRALLISVSQDNKSR